jgi:hypothetical protein
MNIYTRKKLLDALICFTLLAWLIGMPLLAIIPRVFQ